MPWVVIFAAAAVTYILAACTGVISMSKAIRSPDQDLWREAKSWWRHNGSLPLSRPHAWPSTHASNFEQVGKLGCDSPLL